MTFWKCALNKKSEVSSSGFSSCLLLKAAPGFLPHVEWLNHITSLPDDKDQIKPGFSLSCFLPQWVFSSLFSSFEESNEVLDLNISSWFVGYMWERKPELLNNKSN